MSATGPAIVAVTDGSGRAYAGAAGPAARMRRGAPAMGIGRPYFLRDLLQLRAFVTRDMDTRDPAELARQLTELKLEHRDLDSAIGRLALDRGCDEIQLRRLKKRKLRIKDMIAYLESRLIPDLDA